MIDPACHLFGCACARGPGLKAAKYRGLCKGRSQRMLDEWRRGEESEGPSLSPHGSTRERRGGRVLLASLAAPRGRRVNEGVHVACTVAGRKHDSLSA